MGRGYSSPATFPTPRELVAITARCWGVSGLHHMKPANASQKQADKGLTLAGRPASGALVPKEDKP